MIEDYVQHLANYNLHLVYEPDAIFGESFQYDNRIHFEFNMLYHWHPFMPDVFNIDGTTYTLDDFQFSVEPVLRHGMAKIVDSFSRSLAGKVHTSSDRNYFRFQRG